MTDQAMPFPTERCPSKEKELLTMILGNAHIHECAIPGKSIMTVLLNNKQINRLCCYGIEDEDLEDSHDAEQDDAA